MTTSPLTAPYTGWRTWANALTLSRVVATPFVIVILLQSPDEGSWLATSAWFLVSSTDLIDGWIARFQGLVSTTGAFLDPLADKVATLGAMTAFVFAGRMFWLPVGIIFLREMAMTLYRSRVARRGVSVPARRLAKWKTFFQSLAVGAIVFPPVANKDIVPEIFLWLGAAFALISGLQYVFDYKNLEKSTKT